MSRTYSIGQRCMAYVLLVSFLLQSCYNPSIQNGPLAIKEEGPRVKIVSRNQEDKPIEVTSRNLKPDLGHREETIKEEPLELGNSTSRIAYSSKGETTSIASKEARTKIVQPSSSRANPPAYTTYKPAAKNRKSALVGEENRASQMIERNSHVVQRQHKRG